MKLLDVCVAGSGVGLAACAVTDLVLTHHVVAASLTLFTLGVMNVLSTVVLHLGGRARRR